jgi:hypothetical protein
MTNSKKNSKQLDRSPITNQHTMPDGRWTLLFMGKHGRTITLKRFKGMVFSTLFILAVFVALTIGLFWWNLNMLEERNQLENQIEKIAERSEALRHEKDILLTRLVVAESRVQEYQFGGQENQSGEKYPDPEEQDLSSSGPSGSIDQTTTDAEVQTQVQPHPDSDQPDAGLRVTIENFKLSARSNNDSIRIQFIIKNDSLYSQYVSGHAIVVLKGKEIQQDRWMSLPRVPLVEGRPSGNRQGQAFGISNYKTMRFTASAPEFYEKLQIATVFVFTNTGQLLLEQDFPVDLTAGSG